MQKVFKKSKITVVGINFYNSSKNSGNHYIYDERTNVLLGVSDFDINKKKKECENQALKCKVIECDNCVFLIIFKTNLFEPQFGILSTVYSQLTNLMEFYKNIGNGIKTVFSQETGLFIFDLMRLILDIRDGWITGSKVITTLMSLYSLFQRFKDVKRRYEAQVYILNDVTFDSLILMFSAIGVPRQVLDILKTFSEITGKKLFNSNLILSLISSLYDLFKSFISWMCEVLPNCAVYIGFFESIVDYLFSAIVNYSKIKKVVDLYSKYIAEANVILDPKFRSECENLHKQLKKDVSFREYVDNSDNKHFKTTWDGFVNNLMKYINNFDISKRDEPICIVLEGRPGSGKSVLMNNLVEYLVRKNFSVYVHTVPPTEGGKDFYDDYENQDVFVMDDVGQQGVSQWRTIINFVAPVKYPLECAEAKKKNTKFFNSKFIICTTNKFTGLSSFTTSDCIAEPGALFRRAHVIKVTKNDSDILRHLTDLSYFKYDYKNENTFKNEFLYHNSTDILPTSVSAVDTREGLMYVMSIFKHLIKTEEENRKSSILSEVDFEWIDENLEFQPQMKLSSYINILREPFKNLNLGYEIFDEWYGFVRNRIFTFIDDCLTFLFKGVSDVSCKDFPFKSSLKNLFERASKIDKFMLSIFGVFMGVTIGLYIFGWNDCSDDLRLKNENLLHRWEKQTLENKNWELGTTGLKDTPPSDVVTSTIKKLIRFVVGKKSNGEIFYSQGLVGGRYILLNSHTNADNSSIDVYNTYEHFMNNHKELESVTIRKVRDYPSVDLCIYKLTNISITYKSPRALFGRNPNIEESRFAYPFMYLISSLGVIPVVTGAHVNPNTETVKYSAYGVHYEHRPKSGYITNVEGQGLCGSLLINPQGMIMGVHVAGDGVSGFVATPSNEIISDIRSYMCYEDSWSYDIDEKIIENFSGARLKYDDGEVKTSQVTNNVPMVMTPLHRDICPEMRTLIGTIHDDTSNTYSTVLMEDKKINNRKPPNLTDSPINKLKETAKKTFKIQGYVNDAELKFIGDCIDTILPESFVDTSFDEAAFGDELAAMAKDTSNGYGHVRSKEALFDFETRKLTDLGLKEIYDFRDRVLHGKPELKDFLSREVFKVNELRNEEKADKPRTIRVMPVTHIYWTKVICGELAKHFKKNMHATGVCIGFNPYKDFHQLAMNLKSGSIVGDADYGGWDGTLNARIMFTIFDRIKLRYKGDYPEILDFLATTIVRSMVLVGDEVYATTHGMPSGTWLTLLLNCLVNKAITALTIYRNKKDASPEDFLAVISYVTGDDNIFATPGYLVNAFNLRTLKETAESLGMTCTNGDKTPIVTLGQEFDKLNYLKRHFRMHPVLRKYMGCLSLSTILNTLQYYDSSKNFDEAMQGKINAVSVESYIHSPALYLLVKDFIEKNCPGFNILSEARIINILKSDDGYHEILDSLGKAYGRL